MLRHSLALICLLWLLAASATAQPAPELFIVHLTTGPAWDKDKPAPQQAGFAQHSQNLSRLRGLGSILVGARYQDSAADKGMLIIRAANREAVTALFEPDPMVRDKLFVLDIAAFKPFYDGFVPRPAPPAATDAASSLNNLAWMAGCWAGKNGRFEFREHWMRPAGGVMLGMGRTLMDGKLSSTEAMRITLDEAGTPLFTPKPSGKPEATFKAIRFDAGSIVFENPEKDFPQRVLYRLGADGSLQARIEGQTNGRERGIDFPMQRASCE